MSNYAENFQKAKTACGNKCRACDMDLTNSSDCVFMFSEHFDNPPELNLTKDWADVECQLKHFILLCPVCHRDALGLMCGIRDLLKQAIDL